MKSKKKNGNNRKLRLILFSLIVLAISIRLILLKLQYIQWYEQEDIEYSETIILPLDSKTGISTSSAFSGWVTITVSGIGKINNRARVDGFYYVDKDSEDSHYRGLEINGQLVFYIPQMPEPPDYNLDHTYKFQYYAGKQPQTLVFSSSDETPENNTGEFAIEVSARELYHGW